MPDTDERDGFAAWLAAVDRLVMEKYALTLADLPDLLMTRDAFDNGTSPEVFFREDVMALIRDEFGAEAADGDE
jgi:hypothetical protein